MPRILSRVLVLQILSLLLAGTAFPQGSQSGGITGSVKDQSGANIGGATITIVNNATKAVERSVTSTADGLFTATLLPPGDYTVNVKAQGFKTFSSQVAVLLNETSRLDAKLEVGTVTETVEVTANAALVNTESAVTGNPIDSQTMAALP